MEKLNKNSPVPLYFQMAELIKNKIESKEWKINKIIPSELKLCEDFQISRGTVRQAINHLIQEGYLYRRHGVGTFTTKPIDVNPVSNFYCVDFDNKDLSTKLNRKLISKKIIKPNGIIKKTMQLSNNEKVYMIEELITNKNKPISLEVSYWLKSLLPKLKSKDIVNKAPYQIALQEYSIDISKVHESFSVKEIDKKIADKLGTQCGEYALSVDRITWSQDIVIEYRQSIIRTDRCRYTVKIL